MITKRKMYVYIALPGSNSNIMYLNQQYHFKIAFYTIKFDLGMLLVSVNFKSPFLS